MVFPYTAGTAQLTNEPPVMNERYTLLSIILHWLTAGLILALFVIGWSMVDLPRGPERSATFALHKSLGLSVLLLSIFRVLWRWRFPAPPYANNVARWKIRAARIVHALFYVALFLQPLSGYISSSFSGYKTKWFGLPLPHWGYRDPPLNEFFTDIHVATSVVLAGLIALHVAGALTHLLARDGLFSRMLPGRRA